MKIFTFTVVLLLTCISTFAQTPVCPSYFRRNNGNGGGCTYGQLKVYFTNCPAVPPVIDSVYINGTKLNANFDLPDASKCASNGYISYCISGNVVQTTDAWQIYFSIPGSTVSYSCNVANGGLLPVKYLSFDAVVNDMSVLLKWVTVEGINNSHFEVERSFDMINYSTIGLVLDGITVNGDTKSYQFKDNAAILKSKTMVYYRIKQFDIDGKETVSKILAVRLQAKSDVLMQVSPNPFIENLNVRFNSTETGTAQIRIVNVTGQTLLSKQSTISKGYNNIQVDGLSGLATGMYVAQLIMNGVVIDNQRVIKN